MSQTYIQLEMIRVINCGTWYKNANNIGEILEKKTRQK